MDVITRKCHCKQRQPLFGVKGGKPTHCGICKTDNMINVKSRKCQCGKAEPAFGIDGGQATHCGKCKSSDLVNVRNKWCLCKRAQPTYGVKGGRPTHCARCRTSELVDVVHKRCLNGCGTIVHGRYRGFCLRCFVYLFPGEKVSRNYKVKEQHFVDYIKEAGVLPDSAEVTFDKRLQGGCSARKPDIFVDLLTHTLHAENDEKQHRSYACENKRLMELFQDSGNRPQIQLRFNPDSFTSANGTKHPSCFKYNKLGVPVIRDQAIWKARMDIYLERFTYHLTHVPDREVTVEHMFYDGYDWRAEEQTSKVGQKRKHT
jgi:hypothetical protein